MLARQLVEAIPIIHVSVLKGCNRTKQTSLCRSLSRTYVQIPLLSCGLVDPRQDIFLSPISLPAYDDRPPRKRSLSVLLEGGKLSQRRRLSASLPPPTIWTRGIYFLSSVSGVVVSSVAQSTVFAVACSDHEQTRRDPNSLG